MSHIGGGELLRAVMTANALSARPFFYVAELSGQDGTAAPMSQNTASIQVKPQTSFLMTSVFGLTSSAFVDQAEFVNIFDASNLKGFADGSINYDSLGGVRANAPRSVYTGFLGDTLHSCMTLPVYTLWEPNSLIGILWTGHNQVLPIQLYRYLILAGVEYQLEGPRQ